MERIPATVFPERGIGTNSLTRTPAGQLPADKIEWARSSETKSLNEETELPGLEILSHLMSFPSLRILLLFKYSIILPELVLGDNL